MNDLVRMCATEMVTACHAGHLSVCEIADAFIERIEARQEIIAAYVHFDPQRIRENARRLDGLSHKGPLHGVPVAVKDVIATHDMPTGYNSPRYRSLQTGIDAACVDRLRSAGALIVGKTVTTEFAASSKGGPTRNPRNLAYSPGGSSSGSAAAVADFQAALAVGTQTGGSTIRPASFCGIFGWKPTWNSISREGVKMYSATCDTVGFFARNAPDLSLLADVYELDPLQENYPCSVSAMRVAFCRSPVWRHAMPETRDAMASAVHLLQQAGAEVTELTLPEPFERLHDAHRKILDREGRSALLNEVRATPDINPNYVATVNEPVCSVAEYRAAYRLSDQCRAEFDEIAAGFDLVLTPSAKGQAPEGTDYTGDAVFNEIWTLLQVPVVNVPCTDSSDGLPVGVSVVGRRYDDRRIIQNAGVLGEILHAACRL